MSDSTQNKQITKKYVSGLKGKAKAVVDAIRAKGLSDEANCVHELLFLCDYFEKNAERLANVEKEKDAQITKLVGKSEYTEKMLNALQNKFLVLESSKSDIQTKLQDVLHSLDALEKERNALLKTIEDMKNQLRLANHDRNMAHNNVEKLETQIAGKMESLKESAQVLEAHKVDIENLRNYITKRNSELSGMQKERDRCIHEVEMSAHKIKKKDAQLTELSETLAKSKAEQDLCRTHSIDLSRKLDAAVSECIVLRRDVKVMTKHRDEIEEERRKTNVENDALKESVARLEKERYEAEKEIEELKRTSKILKTDLERSYKKQESLNSSLQQKSQDIVDLTNAITTCEKSIVKLYNQVQDRQNEKDFISTQIIRRNDEIALLTEKLEVTQLALCRGESQYNDRLEDLRVLTIELKNSKATVDCLKANALKMENWKNQIGILQRELEDKKIENAKLLNELQSPLNVHRWRLLAGQDPNRLELIQKIQLLQRRILNQSAIIADKEKLLTTPNQTNFFGTSLSDTKLTITQTKLLKARRALKQRTKRLKSLEAECRAWKCEVSC